MIKLKGAVIVEGKYDKIHLENFIDALIIPTNGFALFSDKEKLKLIRLAAERDGIIVMTDSDSAGRVIRSYLKQCIGSDKITNVYLPQILGKERRKKTLSAEGILGVEGISKDIILSALEKSGVTAETVAQKSKKITTADFYKWNLSGKQNSLEQRKSLLKFLNLPDNLTKPAMLDYINCAYTYQDFVQEVEKWQNSQDKR